MCKEMAVIPVDRVVEKKIIIRKNGGPRRRTNTRVCRPQNKEKWTISHVGKARQVQSRCSPSWHAMLFTTIFYGIV
jgi:hypothetical protein